MQNEMILNHELILGQTQNAFIRKIYLSFNFIYFPSYITDQNDNNYNENQIQNLVDYILNSYIKDTKFLTYHITEAFDINKSISSNNDSNSNISHEMFNFIICLEKKCLIINKMKIELINKMITIFKIKKIMMLNYSNIFINEDESIYAKREVQNIFDYLIKEIKGSKFIQNLIPPIAGYLIRRYFYRSNYFQDQSFFTFDQPTSIEENNVKKQISNLLISDNLSTIANNIYFLGNIKINKSIKPAKYTFKNNDFIILRTIYSNKKGLYDLVIHKESLYIFLYKKITTPEKYEIEFCENHFHRCFTRFYGFVREKENIIGFIYEFMCNGSLQENLNQGKIDKTFQMLTIERIYEGIEYLNSHFLIHRDLKPANILLDHDYIPYINDFETIRQPNNDSDDSSSKTNDIGSIRYTSIEQDKGEYVSYPTDIYSFGLIIYFIFEKEHFTYNYDKTEGKAPLLLNVSSTIQKLFSSCIKILPKDRITIQQIKSLIFEEATSFLYWEHILLNKEAYKENIHLVNFIYENIYILCDTPKILQKFTDNAFNFKNMYMMNDPQLYFGLASAYFQKQDYKKSLKYFELAAENKFPYAYLCLGSMYLHGIGVERDLMKAKEYFELGVQLNDVNSLVNLGSMYLIGAGVEVNAVKAREYFELAAELNDSSAFLNLGCIYMYGLGVKQDCLLAKEYFETSARLNNPDAIFNIGNVYFYGHGVDKNYVKSKEYYEKAAYQNNSNALFMLANQYFDGLGVDQNYKKAIEYYESSARLGNQYAILKLGYFYEKGFIYKQNYLEAKKHYEYVANFNNPMAFVPLGNLYMCDQFPERNYSKAIKYYELATKYNDSLAFLNLGKIYEFGLGVSKNQEKAIEYYESAAKLNDQNAQLLLGLLYSRGQKVKKDYIKAKKYFELAAEQNNSDAYLNLAALYLNGFGVSKDFWKGIRYVEMAAKLYNSQAFIILGTMYEEGSNITRDYSKAIEYYTKAAKLNNSFGYLRLGLLYLDGSGVKQDFLIAKYYFEIASSLNNSYAILNLGNLYLDGKGVDLDYSKAMEYYIKSASLNNSAALMNIGILYLYGLGVKKNYSKTKEYFELSAKQGDIIALSNLAVIYAYGLGEPIDYSRAKYYFEQAAAKNYAPALSNLGNISFEGLDGKKDYLKAKKYYEQSAQLNDSVACYKLGCIYEEGLGVQKDYFLAKYFYEKSAQLGNHFALENLGHLYEDGLGVKQDYLTAIQYYYLGAKQNDSNAFFHLGYLYSTGEFFDINISKSIYYLLKCIKNFKKVIMIQYTITNITERFFYRSHNDLGLIYITYLNDVEKANKHLKEAAFAEYPFAQSNFGLLNQFYFNNTKSAEHMFERSSKNKFAIADYNLGYLNEVEKGIENSIQHYLNASENEESPLIFHGLNHFDLRHEISKTFIICFTNLKLSAFYFSKSNFDDSKKFFIKSFAKLNLNTEEQSYHFCFKGGDIYQYIKSFILNFPKFNLVNQPNLSDELKSKIQNFSNKNNENDKNKFTSVSRKQIKSIYQKDGHIELTTFEAPSEMFDFIMKMDEIKKKFIDEINEILNIMHSVLYTPPYPILFGRISIVKSEQNSKKVSSSYMKCINRLFYDGLGNDLSSDY